MEVRPGYKQTEVGVIPEDWEVQAARRISRQSLLAASPSRDERAILERRYSFVDHDVEDDRTHRLDDRAQFVTSKACSNDVSPAKRRRSRLLSDGDYRPSAQISRTRSDARA